MLPRQFPHEEFPDLLSQKLAAAQTKIKQFKMWVKIQDFIHGIAGNCCNPQELRQILRDAHELQCDEKTVVELLQTIYSQNRTLNILVYILHEAPGYLTHSILTKVISHIETIWMLQDRNQQGYLLLLEIFNPGELSRLKIFCDYLKQSQNLPFGPLLEDLEKQPPIYRWNGSSPDALSAMAMLSELRADYLEKTSTSSAPTSQIKITKCHIHTPSRRMPIPYQKRLEKPSSLWSYYIPEQRKFKTHRQHKAESHQMPAHPCSTTATEAQQPGDQPMLSIPMQQPPQQPNKSQPSHQLSQEENSVPPNDPYPISPEMLHNALKKLQAQQRQQLQQQLQSHQQTVTAAAAPQQQFLPSSVPPQNIQIFLCPKYVIATATPL